MIIDPSFEVLGGSSLTVSATFVKNLYDLNTLI